ncbi:Transposase and inactivated derivatives, TnpA family [Tessaracoccus bendigoensis DSM 12906]|uniref:Transposase and inactivated derivatives, TnpA family n=1 Tax=Tessaracoccus bendigoensis DSM 12906 TaxID=1123357 RepID=A0A1M6HWN1_9ACTN|nr:Tn3 family transposase [Tessaracoccus bendigoensis]SHJ26636.1 Transposase and inactivated derivatives, TnpA family [Tessaracoccus bendigoensis DSM 12906]
MEHLSDDVGELVEFWTLLDEDRVLLEGRRGATALGFALLLKHFSRHGRFPRSSAEVSDAVVGFVARQVGVSAADFGSYEWSGSTIEYHRSQIRAHLGFRVATIRDQEKLTAWLAANVAHAERRPDRVREELLAQFRVEQLEPPTPGRVLRMVRSALRTAEQEWTLRISASLNPLVSARLLCLIDAEAEVDDGGDPDGTQGSETALGLIKSMPGNVSLESMMTEISKLEAVRAIGLPAGLFADAAPKVLDGWRARAAVEAPSHLRRHPEPLTLTLLAALVYQREREITDTLVELLIATVHRIGARAERRVTDELINAFKRVSGKENILFSIAEAALEKPDDAVRAVVFPAVTGGEQTLRELVHEFKTKGPVYRRTVQTTLKASYTGHYRRGLIALLEVLEFRSNNTAHRPVIDALTLIGRYAKAGNLTYYPLEVDAPAHRGATGDWSELVYRIDTKGRQRVARMVYEVVTFQALRDQLRCKEIWVLGADSWRNPDEDLPADFEDRRAENYQELRKPLDPAEFIDSLRDEMTAALGELDAAIPALDWLDITDRASGAITLTRYEAAPEPRNLRRIKGEVRRRWGTVALIDILKETVLRTGCLNQISAVAGGGTLPVEVLAERLMLAIYAYGTNTGIRSVAAGGGHEHSEDEIRYVRRRYLTRDTAAAVAIGIADATFAARQQAVWGEGSTAVASDSTHFRSYDQNIFTEWHSRYGGRGILIYWHVERGSMVVHSQTLRASASEVHAMVEGAIRHGTTMKVEGNYVDTHGQSEIGFGITRLLGFDLLPRIKQINRVRLYRPVVGRPDAYPHLTPALTRPIRWDLVEENYDQMIKYATAIRQGTASTEAILRRFTRSASHPTYQAMLEVGRAQRTIFVARYLRSRELQREITEGLNVVEAFNGANSVIYYGKGGEIASNRKEEQEMTVLCLRILQAALVYVNTLLLQDILAEDDWADVLTAEDRRGLTPLFWQHVLPYGEVKLDMTARLNIRTTPPNDPPASPIPSP